MGKKFEEWTKKRPDLFKGELKSWKLFANMLGGAWGGYVEMWEYENLSDAEKHMNKMLQDKEFTTEFYAPFLVLIVPGTYSMNVWRFVM